MLINLHSQAVTTPKTRAEIQASDAPARVLSRRYGTTEQTVWKWRKRDSVNDRSHMAHNGCKQRSHLRKKPLQWPCARRCRCLLMTCSP